MATKLKIRNEWWSAPATGDSGELIIVTGRRDMAGVRATGAYNYRVEISWDYAPDSQGMPNVATSTLMEQVGDAMEATFSRDPVAVIVGIYTGGGRRDWIVYTRSLHIFQRKLNEALATFEQTLPLQFAAYDDPEWNEYDEILATEIPDEE